VSEKAKFFHANNTVLIFAKIIINRLCRYPYHPLRLTFNADWPEVIEPRPSYAFHFTFHEQQHVITKKQSTWAVSST